MNPAQLLNPKAFAKEQAKAQAQAQAQAKSSRGGVTGQKNGAQYATNNTPGHRPGAGPYVQNPSYSPASLLNPRAASSKHMSTDENVNSFADEAMTPADNKDEFGARGMIEKLHGVTDREEAPRKRKIAVVDDGDDDDERKKPKTQDAHAGKGGGIITDHMKNQRKEAEPIDLTNDDDDVQIIKESGGEEVTLGLINTSINAFRIPAYSPGLMRSIPKTHWPMTKIGFKREKRNNNVIELLDFNKTKFGTMDILAAMGMVPLIDGGAINRVRLRMELLSRPREQNEFAGAQVSKSMKMTVTIYAPRNKVRSLGVFLSQRKLFLQAPLRPTGREYYNPQQPVNYAQIGGSKPQTSTYKSSSSGLVQRSTELMRREASTMFDSLPNSEEIPELEATDIITTPLMAHQKKGLHFLMEHERDDYEDEELPKHSLWKYQATDNGKPAWYHLITNQEVFEKPAPVRGGILADMMGLGKTLSILALIAQTKAIAKSFYGRSEVEDVDCNSRGTLIICPKSVLSNWEEQIRIHTVRGEIKFYSYHGTSRMQDTYKLAKYDVILTSYNTAAAEFGHTSSKKALSRINWFRIVLDEAHQIRNQQTSVSKACCQLYAQRRWAVTGTPVQNTLLDLGALLKFLRIPPLDSPQQFAQSLMAPFKNGDPDVIQHLQLLVGSITLRRLKDTIDLPDRKQERVRLNFSNSEAALYKQFASTSRTQLSNITGGGSGALRGKAYAHVLKSIGRLRAICAHGREMLTEDDMKEVEGDDPGNAIVIDLGDEPGMQSEDSFTSDNQAYTLFKLMQDSDADRCISCNERITKNERGEQPDDDDDTTDPSSEDDTNDHLAFLTPCMHLICPDCEDRYKKECEETMTQDRHHICPFDENYQHFGMKPLTRSGLNFYNQERIDAAKKPRAAKWDEHSYTGPHTKVQALIEDLRKSEAESAELASLGDMEPIKSVVFSGWTQYMDLIGYALERENFGFVRLDGSMSVKQRTQVLEDFKNDPAITVMLVSIKAGGQGLNFTVASKVYVMEPQFNPGVEHQAVDRVHRLGQKRPVHIKHFIMNDSVEEGILMLQQKKEKLASMSMEKKRSKAEENKQRMEELRALFK